MAAKVPIATQREILELEQQVFKLQQEIVRLKAKHEQQMAKLQAENQKLRDRPIVLSEEQLNKIRALRRA
jgi:regulator of replication initiation timing